MIIDFRGQPKVVGGVEHPLEVPFTPAQEDSVVALTEGSRVVCTGTLVTPWAVLSAAHCDAVPGVEVRVGRDVASPIARAVVTDVEVQGGSGWPKGDVALLRLDRSLSFPPLQVGEATAADAVQAAGYGRTQPGVEGNTLRWWVVEDVKERGDGWFRVDGAGRHGLCAGDSGGPAFVAGPRVVGVVSQGEVSCVGSDLFAVPDPTWVRGVLGSWGGPGKRPWAAPKLIAGIGLVGGLLVVGMLSARSRGRSERSAGPALR